nr:uncharacterized protein LOC127315985 [Lolium perenne]
MRRRSRLSPLFALLGHAPPGLLLATLPPRPRRPRAARAAAGQSYLARHRTRPHAPSPPHQNRATLLPHEATTSRALPAPADFTTVGRCAASPNHDRPVPANHAHRPHAPSRRRTWSTPPQQGPTSAAPALASPDHRGGPGKKAHDPNPRTNPTCPELTQSPRAPTAGHPTAGEDGPCAADYRAPRCRLEVLAASRPPPRPSALGLAARRRHRSHLAGSRAPPPQAHAPPRPSTPSSLRVARRRLAPRTSLRAARRLPEPGRRRALSPSPHASRPTPLGTVFPVVVGLVSRSGSCRPSPSNRRPSHCSPPLPWESLL